MFACCGGPPPELAGDPVPLDDQRTWQHVEELRGRLSRIIKPVDVDFDRGGSATVNLTSLPSGSLGAAGSGGSMTSGLGAFQRRQSMRLDTQQSQGLSQQGAMTSSGNSTSSGSSLTWTDSRKLLEAAIAIEQLEAIPENAVAGSGSSWGSQWERGVEMEEQRLQMRLYRLKLENAVMAGDGNCQFRAVSFTLYGTQQYHPYVRQKAVEYMQRQRKDFECFLGEEFGSYIRQMSKQGTWGDELTLRAACEALAVVVNVITSDEANWFLRYIPRTTRPMHELFLTYIAPVHYNAVRRQGTGDRLRHSFGRQHSQIARAVSTYRRNYGIPETPQHVMAAGLVG